MTGANVERALQSFRVGELEAGFLALREYLSASPNDLNARGHLAWALMGSGRYDEADAEYRELGRMDPGNPEIGLRREQIAALRRGCPSRSFGRMVRAARKCSQDRGVWESFSEFAIEHGSHPDQVLVHRHACRLFPDHAPFRVRFEQARTRVRRDFRHALFVRLGGPAVFRLLLKSSRIRNMISEHGAGSEQSLRLAFQSFYEEGAVHAVFVQTPEHQRPDRFQQYFDSNPELWWQWFRDHTPDKSISGKCLIDIGSGPGCVGHHFQCAGYRVTALSGSRADLQECAMRGMETLEAEMHSIPVPPGSFDAALASHVLEHSIVPFVLLREIWRVLKPGGLLYINLPFPIEQNVANDYPGSYDASKDSFSFETDPVTRRTKVLAMLFYAHGVEDHVFVLTYWQWRWLFRHAGFEVVDSAINLLEADEMISWDESQTRPELAKVGKNQLFILRKKQLGAGSPVRQIPCQTQPNPR